MREVVQVKCDTTTQSQQFQESDRLGGLVQTARGHALSWQGSKEVSVSPEP